jgi:hypothetical protein
LLDGKSADAILEIAREGIGEFERRRLKYMLYE